MSFDKEDAKILVVDDDKHLADNLVEYLFRLGYHATAAYGGREAVELFQKERFHLVVTDLMMPEMGGTEVLEAVKALDKSVVMMMITGYGTVESAVAAMKKGAQEFITKPFRMSDLEGLIAGALERHPHFR